MFDTTFPKQNTRNLLHRYLMYVQMSGLVTRSAYFLHAIFQMDRKSHTFGLYSILKKYDIKK